MITHGQTSVQARLAETDRIRADLIGSVSHEVRTPLTGIRGAGLTLRQGCDQLADAARRQGRHPGCSTHEERCPGCWRTCSRPPR